MISLDAVRSAVLSADPYNRMDALVRTELASGRAVRAVFDDLNPLVDETLDTPGLPHDGQEAFLGTLGDPSYRPEQRLLVKVDTRVVSHVHLTERGMRYGSVRVPMNGVMWVGTLPEYRGQGFAQHLMRLADGRVTVAEGELLRAIADSLDCPMPPLLAA